MMYRATVYLDAVIRVEDKDITIRRYRHKKRFNELAEAQRFISEFPEPGTVTNDRTDFGCVFRIGGHELAVLDVQPEVDDE